MNFAAFQGAVRHSGRVGRCRRLRHPGCRYQALPGTGLIPFDPGVQIETAFPNVYAVGDVTSVGTPKAGVFAEGQAAVVADEIIARQRHSGSSATYDGTGICYIEFGHDQVARVEVTFRSGERPNGHFDHPSEAYLADKSEFGSSRVRRWFNRDWTNYRPLNGS